MKMTVLFAATLATVSAPALAAPDFNINFNRTSGNASGANFTFSATPAQTPVVTLNAAARLYSGSPSALTNTSQLSTAGTVYWTVPGIGVVGGANNQLDTNVANRREALTLSANRTLSLSAAKFSWTDENDTVSIFGVGTGGAMTLLAAGSIRNGFTGATIDPANTSPGAGNANSNFARLIFDPRLPAYRNYVFTTQLGGSNSAGQGYFLNQLTAGAVPEPASWAMMIAGFGAVGFASRRRRTVPQVFA